MTECITYNPAVYRTMWLLPTVLISPLVHGATVHNVRPGKKKIFSFSGFFSRIMMRAGGFFLFIFFFGGLADALRSMHTLVSSPELELEAIDY